METYAAKAISPKVGHWHMAKSGRSTRHHYIPKTIQRAFTVGGTKDNIWYAEKFPASGAFKSPELRNISSVFMERNLYTVNYGSAPSDIIERSYYGPLDDYLGVVVPKLIAALDQKAVPTFTEEAEGSMRSVAIEMLRRTPATYENLGVDEIASDVFLRPPSHNYPAAERQIFLDQMSKPEEYSKFKKELFARARIRPLENVNKTLKDFSIRWAACRGNHSLILSSRYCYMLGNGGRNGLANEKVELWMPISPKYCMVLVRDPFKRVPMLSEINSSMIRKFNLHSSKNSHAVASHSQKLIESITRSKAIFR